MNIMNTKQANTLQQSMSLTDLNFQINKQSSKAMIEFVRSYSTDLSHDILKGIRKMHEDNVGKDAPQDPEDAFAMFAEIIQDAIESRLEILKLDIPAKKRGRVAKKKLTNVNDIVAVEDSDDETPKKRGRKKKVVVEDTLEDALNELGLKTVSTKTTKTIRVTGSKFKIFRRMEKMVEKPKHSGKFKKAVPWRKVDYTLKDGESWLDTWCVAERAPKKGAITFDHKPTDEEFAQLSGASENGAAVEKKPSAVEKKPVAVEKKPVAVEKKPVAVEKKPAAVENPEEVNEADEVKDAIKGLVEELEEEDYQEEQFNEENTAATVFNFTPSGEYLPFVAIDGEEDLIYYTDTSVKQFGMIVDSKTGEHKGWIMNEDADEMVDNKPEYEHEEGSDGEEELDLMSY
jgi:hypothetical protein